MKIRLEPVTVASRAAVERLETAPGQEGFVESVAECLAEADRRRCWTSHAESDLHAIRTDT